MIRIPDLELPTTPAAQLIAWQREIDNIQTYAGQIDAAKHLFTTRNIKHNQTFSVVRRYLDALCFGERSCAYCERSMADEVEHVRPKSLFPGAVFVWRNYIYACGPCNGVKLNNYPRRIGGVICNVSRRRGEPIVPPPAGDDLLIDPRAEDPAEFLQLDLNTCQVIAVRGLDPSRAERAHQTIDTIGLNRPGLIKARGQHLQNYIARLQRYIFLRDHDEVADADAYAADIQTMGHPMVWNEMRRQYGKYSQLQRLFVQAPEALTWTPSIQGLT
jgi:uncharacterized protein (TIGR02646 family)